MKKKQPIPFSEKFPNVGPLALCLLERLLEFDPRYRPSAEEVRSIFQNMCSNALFSSVNPFVQLSFLIKVIVSFTGIN